MRDNSASKKAKRKKCVARDSVGAALLKAYRKHFWTRETRKALKLVLGEL